MVSANRLGAKCWHRGVWCCRRALRNHHGRSIGSIVFTFQKCIEQRPACVAFLLAGLQFSLYELAQSLEMCSTCNCILEQVTGRPHAQSITESFHGYKGYPGYEPETPVASQVAHGKASANQVRSSSWVSVSSRGHFCHWEVQSIGQVIVSCSCAIVGRVLERCQQGVLLSLE